MQQEFLNSLVRNLGLPGVDELDKEIQTRINRCHNWYAAHGDPWSQCHEVLVSHVYADRIQLANKAIITSRLLAMAFARESVDSMAVIGVSAGRSVDQKIDELWKADRPDESMFLAAYATTVAEELRSRQIQQIDQRIKRQNLTALQVYSPGYYGWDLADQQALYWCLPERGPLGLLESHCLRPTRSSLSVVGITAKACASTSKFWLEISRGLSPQCDLKAQMAYVFPEKALRKWARDRLTLNNETSRWSAKFRFEGTTCSSMGMPFSLDYNVELVEETTGVFRIDRGSCDPPDTKYQNTCAYRSAPREFMNSLQSACPLQNKRLDAVLTWQPQRQSTGCACLAADRNHKWQLTLQTIHFALENKIY